MLSGELLTIIVEFVIRLIILPVNGLFNASYLAERDNKIPGYIRLFSFAIFK